MPTMEVLIVGNGGCGGDSSGELLSNGNFYTFDTTVGYSQAGIGSTSDWDSVFTSPCTGSVAWDSISPPIDNPYGLIAGSAKISISHLGTERWGQNFHHQLFPDGIHGLSQDRTYSYSYWARSDSSKTVYFVIERNGGDYYKIVDTTVALNTTWQHFDGTFTGTTIPGGSMIFNYSFFGGLTPINYWVGGCSLRKYPLREAGGGGGGAELRYLPSFPGLPGRWGCLIRPTVDSLTTQTNPVGNIARFFDYENFINGHESRWPPNPIPLVWGIGAGGGHGGFVYNGYSRDGVGGTAYERSGGGGAGSLYNNTLGGQDGTGSIYSYSYPLGDNWGGNGSISPYGTAMTGGGGGGAGSVGIGADNTNAGNGGEGYLWHGVRYGAGGGGSLCGPGTVGVGGTNGGAGVKNGPGEPGVNGTGAGGGGSSSTDGTGYPGGVGGSGTIIIRYVTAQWGRCTGGIITTDGTDTVHTFLAQDPAPYGGSLASYQIFTIYQDVQDPVTPFMIY